METWDKTYHDFGTTSSNTTLTHTFTYTGSKEVSKIEPLCNCVGFRFENNKLYLRWKIKPNLKEGYHSKKIVAIIYDDDSIDDLTLTAYIHGESDVNGRPIETGVTGTLS